MIDLDRTMGQNGGVFIIVFIQTDSQQYKARPSGREGGLNITYLHPIPPNFCDRLRPYKDATKVLKKTTYKTIK